MDLAAITELFTENSRRILGENLVGIYLHGSAVMDCFNPQKSDIDLIIVVNRSVPDKIKRRFMDMTVELNALAPKKGLELSVVRKSVCKPFIYPTPFELHFSNSHLARYKNDPDGYIAQMQGLDRDLAAHFTIITRRGKALFGEDIEAVFENVKKEYYFDSIWRDIENAAEEISDSPTYMTLNLCRVLAYKEDGAVLSKLEGGEWGMNQLPERFRELISYALSDYASDTEKVYDLSTAREFTEYMLKRIGGKIR